MEVTGCTPRGTASRPIIIPFIRTPYATLFDMPAAGSKPIRPDTADIYPKTPYALSGDKCSVSVVSRNRAFGSVAMDVPGVHGQWDVHNKKEKRHQYNPPTVGGTISLQHVSERAHNVALKTREPMPYGETRISISPYHRRNSIELSNQFTNARLPAGRRLHIPGTEALESHGVPLPAKAQHRSRSAQPTLSPDNIKVKL